MPKLIWAGPKEYILMHMLLVEPEYYSRYPPLGLLKLASYYRYKGASVELMRGCVVPEHKPDMVYVTSLFTWAWKPVWMAINHYKKLFPNVNVWLGGLYASLMPEHARLSGASNIYSGVFENAERFAPAYDLVPKWDGSIVYTSRGCNRTCPYCAVWRMEGIINATRDTIKDLIYPGHKRIILWDNNILQNPHWCDIFDELIEFSQEKGMVIDFNQGLDARLITNESAEKISRMKKQCVRFSYDHKSMEESVKKAIETVSSFGIRRRLIGVYILFNYSDTPDEFFERLRNVLAWGAVAVPLRYQPLDALEYNNHIGEKWDKERLGLYARFRRVCGFGGVFPPYGWLVDRFAKAENFDNAFKLPERNQALEVRAHKDYFNSWRKVQDWRVVSDQFLAKKW